MHQRAIGRRSSSNCAAQARSAAPARRRLAMSGVPSLKSIGIGSPGRLAALERDIDELGDRPPAAMSSKPPARRIAASSVSCGARPVRTCLLGAAPCRSCSRGWRSAPSPQPLDAVGARRQRERRARRAEFRARRGFRRAAPRAPRAARCSQRANQRAMRSKRGHQNARASGKSSSGAKCFAPERDQLGQRIGRQRVGKLLGEIADGAVDDGAAIARRRAACRRRRAARSRRICLA